MTVFKGIVGEVNLLKEGEGAQGGDVLNFVIIQIKRLKLI